VIWEAFQPQTEPRRSFRRNHSDQVAEVRPRTALQPSAVRRARPASPRPAAPAAAAAELAPSNPLPRPAT
jgi:hypothetical protein